MEDEQILRLTSRLSSLGIDFSTSEKSLFDASLDHMRYSFLPLAVVYAKCEDDIRNTLRECNQLDIPVTVRGSGTGCAGGCVPICGGIVLDLSAINFIEIAPESRIAHVGAGAVTADIDAEARKFGLFYAPDPSSHKFSSIGGNIACNAGGLRALKYGTTRENLLSLTAILANGDRITGALPLKKYSVGLNLRDIFVGSEGTLGVVSEAWLKLLPLPKSKITALAFFESDKNAIKAVGKVMCSSVSPAIFEFLDTVTVTCVKKRNPSFDIPENASALLAEFDGEAEETLSQTKTFVEVLKDLSLNVRFSENEMDSEKLWKVRRAASQAMYELGNSKFSQDIVLPYRAVSDFFEFYKALGEKSKLATPVFGHVGDGNYHIHFMYNSSDPTARDRALDSMDEVVVKVIELGGAVSGEHGIGFLKSKYMPLQHSQPELDLMRSIKKLFDPKNILNRGKVYEQYNTRPLYPLNGIKLPWD